MKHDAGSSSIKCSFGVEWGGVEKFGALVIPFPSHFFLTEVQLMYDTMLQVYNTVIYSF